MLILSEEEVEEEYLKSRPPIIPAPTHSKNLEEKEVNDTTSNHGSFLR